MSALRVRRIPLRPPKEQKWRVDGWTGMYDSRHKAGERADKAPILINLNPLEEDVGGPVELRAGLKRVVTPNTTQLAAAAGWQASLGVYFSTGLQLVVISAGEVYTLSTFNGLLNKVLTTAQLAAAAISLAATGRVFLVPFGSSLIVADSSASNQPFLWDGTAGGGLTKLTNVPAAATTRGCTVYYAKAFWIKDSRTIIWSEENQANTGYEAGGFNNAWSLTQTSSANILRLLGTNEGLYYFRVDSVGVIRGAVSATFQTDGVHDSVTQQAGFCFFLSADPVWAGNAVWWFNSEAHPMVFRPDLGAVDLGKQLPRRFASLQGVGQPSATYLGSVGEQFLGAEKISAAFILVDPGNEVVHFELMGAQPGARRVVLLFDSNNLNLLCQHVYQAVNVPLTNGPPWAVILPRATTNSPAEYNKYFCDSQGFIFREPITPSVASDLVPDALGFDETNNGGGSQVEGIVIGPMHGHTADIEWQFTELRVLADAEVTNDLTVGYITSRFHKASLTPADQVKADSASNTPYERSVTFGLNTSGRWLRPVITVGGEVGANRLPQLHGYLLKGVAMSETPNLT